VVKLLAYGLSFFCDAWNHVDLTIVVSWMVSRILHVGNVAAIVGVDPMIFRLFRLIKLLRLLRLVRTVKGFDSLYVMTTAMRSSCSALLWSSVLMMLVLMLQALCLQTLVMDYIRDENNALWKRTEVYLYYGTFARTMFTMFELTLGNFMPPARALVEHVSEWYMLFVIAHKLVIGFSVVSVITGVFIQETFKVATTDDKIMLMQKERAMRVHQRKMQALFNYADDSGDGLVDRAEFCKVMDNTGVRTWLAAMELDAPDADSLFALIDVDGDEVITMKELVATVARLKGPARSFDLIMVMRELRENTLVCKELVETLTGDHFTQTEFRRSKSPT
jgi:hypothetical protein